MPTELSHTGLDFAWPRAQEGLNLVAAAEAIPSSSDVRSIRRRANPKGLGIPSSAESEGVEVELDGEEGRSG
jgi:hypothetical protein